MVRLAKGALTPSCVDVPAAPAPTPAACAVPSQLATTPSSIPAGRVPSATARLDGGPTLHEAPCVLTATHTRIPITEETCVMDRAKRYTPSLRDSRLQRSIILPTDYGWPGRVSLVLVRLLQVRASDIQASCDIRKCVRMHVNSPLGLLRNDLANRAVASQSRLCSRDNEEAAGAQKRSNNFHRD